MNGCKMGSSLSGVYAMAKTSPVENFKDGWEFDMASKWQQFLLGEFFEVQVS